MPKKTKMKTKMTLRKWRETTAPEKSEYEHV